MHAPTRGHGRSRSIPALLGAGLLAMSLAACSDAGAAPSVPSVPGASGAPAASPAGSAGPEASMSPEDALLAFARCMREHGVDLPDPQLSGNGGGQVVAIDPTTPAFRAAEKACEPLLPKFGEMDPAANQAFQDQMLAYAKCMRDHGIDYPDPEFGSGGMASAVELTVDPNSPAFQDAQEACGTNLPGGGTMITVGGEGGTGGAPATNP